jgi:hypothetical protein
MRQDAAATAASHRGVRGVRWTKKSGIFEIGGTKKSRPKTVSRCRIATSGKTSKTREIESFTSQEVAAAGLPLFPS